MKISLVTTLNRDTNLAALHNSLLANIFQLGMDRRACPGRIVAAIQ